MVHDFRVGQLALRFAQKGRNGSISHGLPLLQRIPSAWPTGTSRPSQPRTLHNVISSAIMANGTFPSFPSNRPSLIPYKHMHAMPRCNLCQAKHIANGWHDISSVERRPWIHLATAATCQITRFAGRISDCRDHVHRHGVDGPRDLILHFAHASKLNLMVHIHILCFFFCVSYNSFYKSLQL